MDSSAAHHTNDGRRGLTLEVGSGNLDCIVRCLSRTFRNKQNQGDQTGRGWLERNIFNILESQENMTSESSKNVSKASA